MKKIIALTAAATALALVPAAGASANNGKGNDNGRGACVQLGEIHRALATQGLIPDVHRPGSHRGMAGICFSD